MDPGRPTVSRAVQDDDGTLSRPRARCRRCCQPVAPGGSRSVNSPCGVQAILTGQGFDLDGHWSSTTAGCVCRPRRGTPRRRFGAVLWFPESGSRIDKHSTIRGMHQSQRVGGPGAPLLGDSDARPFRGVVTRPPELHRWVGVVWCWFDQAGIRGLIWGPSAMSNLRHLVPTLGTKLRPTLMRPDSAPPRATAPPFQRVRRGTTPGRRFT